MLGGIQVYRPPEEAFRSTGRGRRSSVYPLREATPEYVRRRIHSGEFSQGGIPDATSTDVIQADAAPRGATRLPREDV